MKPETLEKFFKYIYFVSQYPHDDSRQEDLRDELRALVKAESEPSNVQAEGRGEFVRLPSGVQLQAVTQAEFETAQRIMARWMIEHPQIERLILVRDVPSLGHKPHNLASPGEGYRFLDEDEIIPEEDCPALPEIEWFSNAGWIPNWKGSTRSATYRVPDWLTREQLAQKRKEGK